MRARTLAAAAVACALGVAVGARGQRLDPRRGKTILVGAPRGPSPTDRVDAARSGAAATLLPTGTLHVAWRRNVGMPIDSAPLVDARGDVLALTARGDLVVLAPDGEERVHTSVGAAAASPPTLLSDGTAAFVTTAGDVVGVRLGDVRFRAHVGGGRAQVAPLGLEDGGVVVATQGELVALDGEGTVRARASLDPVDPPVHRVLGGRGSVFVVTASGAVLSWLPASGRETTRVGTFGAATDGGAAFVSAGASGALVAVVGTQVLALDLATGLTTTRATAASAGLLLLVGPPAVRAGGVSVLGLAPSRTIALSFDAAGAETQHQAVGLSLLSSMPDGGATAAQLPSHVGPLVDPRGDVAFALPSGELGVASPAGGVDVVTDVCARFGAPSPPAGPAGRGGATYVGIAPAGPSALVVACGNGVVARIDSDFAPSP